MPKLSTYDDSGFDTSISIKSKNKLATSDSLAMVAGDNRNVTIDVAASRAATDNAAAVTTAGGAETTIKTRIG
jgi:regulator of protease activity HflC (stomatin/prohibitin superfamily)